MVPEAKASLAPRACGFRTPLGCRPPLILPCSAGPHKTPNLQLPPRQMTMTGEKGYSALGQWKEERRDGGQ